MCHEDRNAGVVQRDAVDDVFGIVQVRRQRHDARERFGVAQAEMQRDDAALRKSGEHDAFASMPRARCSSTSSSIDGGGFDRMSASPASGARGSMSYHARIFAPPLIVTARIGACGKTNLRPARPVAELRHDRLEIVAVGAEAMQPDHRGGWVRCRSTSSMRSSAIGMLLRFASCPSHGVGRSSAVSTQ